ncbi:hypothetical protein, partial [Micromonospora sp. AMSO12t]|uniref:hypothetical protein n=1 Tax=Micromonospora sp. AMSO12t TaxID=2650410 RepID=UPI001CED90B7
GEPGGEGEGDRRQRGEQGVEQGPSEHGGGTPVTGRGAVCDGPVLPRQSTSKVDASQWNPVSRKAFTANAFQHLSHIVNINKIHDHECGG